MASVEIKVPDIGDFKDVPVIEILVKPGDAVAKEDSLVTLESDKATMDVPAPVAGTVRELKVKLGDKVSEGSVLLLIDSVQSDSAQKDRAAAPAAQPAAAAPGAASMPAPTQSAPAPVSAPAPAAAFAGKV